MVKKHKELFLPNKAYSEVESMGGQRMCGALAYIYSTIRRPFQLLSHAKSFVPLHTIQVFTHSGRNLLL
jgi:hypothetical protein